MTPTCLITGSSGIGAATAKAMANTGWQVFIASNDEQTCYQLAEELRSAKAVVDFLVVDLNLPETAKELVDACARRFGRLDALYNVAGISGRKFGDGPLLECTDAGWEKVLATNAQTQFRMCRAAIGQMLLQGPDENGERGVILNMSSILGNDPFPSCFDATAYAASKAAVQGLTRHLAASFAKEGIRINAIAPGLVATQMSARASQSPEIVAQMLTKQPLTHGLIRAEDVAAASAFLLTRQSRAITGQVLVVDGGWSLC